MKKPLLLIIRAYKKFISPLLGHHCNFEPTCSAYALEAVEKYGVFRGAFLATKRVIRCHPWRAHTYDPLR